MQKVESYNIVLGCFDDLKIFKYQKSAGVFKPYQNQLMKFVDLIQSTRISYNLLKKLHRISLQNSHP
jgi:hypothetical protein